LTSLIELDRTDFFILSEVDLFEELGSTEIPYFDDIVFVTGGGEEVTILGEGDTVYAILVCVEVEDVFLSSYVEDSEDPVLFTCTEYETYC
jgi:hypothetical protein